MALYKITITLKSPILTQLKGDTIWGHIVWGIQRKKGDEAVEKFLQGYKEGSIPFAVSDAFPKGYIAKPQERPQKIDAQKTLTKEEYAEIKKKKKKKYTEASTYLSFEGDEKLKETEETKKENDIGNVFEANSFVHNTINRMSGTSQGDELHFGVFTNSEQWAKGSDFDIYISASSEYEKKDIAEFFKNAFAFGFGKDASTGNGQIETKEDVKEVTPTKSSNTYMALAPFCLPKLEELEDLRADIFLKKGKASFEIADFPNKKPVVLFQTGATFTLKNPKEAVGVLLRNIHKDKRICSCAFAPIIPI